MKTKRNLSFLIMLLVIPALSNVYAEKPFIGYYYCVFSACNNGCTKYVTNVVKGYYWHDEGQVSDIVSMNIVNQCSDHIKYLRIKKAYDAPIAFHFDNYNDAAIARKKELANKPYPNWSVVEINTFDYTIPGDYLKQP